MLSELRFPSFFYRQRLNAVGIPMLCGVLLFLLFPTLFLPITLLATLVLLSFCLFQKGETGKILVCAAIGLSLSMLLGGITTLREIRSESLAGSVHFAEGTVISASEDHFDLLVFEMDQKKVSVLFRCEGEGDFKMGDRLLVKGEMGNDLSDSDRQDGVFLLCKASEETFLGENFFFSFVGKVRNSLSRSFGEGNVSSFLRAILLGDRSALSSEIKSDFRTTSSSHLLAISGLHITQIIGFLLSFFRLVGIPKRASQWILIPLVFVLFFLAGAGVSVFRASVMMLFVVLSSLFRRRGDSVTALVFAACLVTFHSPYALTDPSFLLSFSSTFAILVCVSPISEKFVFRLSEIKTGPKKQLVFSAFSILSAFLIGSAVFVFNLPIQLLLFGSVSLFSPLYALLFIPVFGLCLFLALLLAIASFLPFSVPFFSDFCRGVFSLFLDWIAAFAAASPAPIEFSSAVAFLIAIALLLLISAFLIFRTKIIRIYELYFALFFLLFFGSFFV